MCACRPGVRPRPVHVLSVEHLQGEASRQYGLPQHEAAPAPAQEGGHGSVPGGRLGGFCTGGAHPTHAGLTICVLSFLSLFGMCTVCAHAVCQVCVLGVFMGCIGTGK